MISLNLVWIQAPSGESLQCFFYCNFILVFTAELQKRLLTCHSFVFLRRDPFFTDLCHTEMIVQNFKMIVFDVPTFPANCFFLKRTSSINSSVVTSIGRPRRGSSCSNSLPYLNKLCHLYSMVFAGEVSW